MSTVAVVAHRGKSLGGGLTRLREVLRDHGVTDPIWHEVNKSRKAPKRVRKALEEGADLVFLWGGDGTVQRGLDVLAGSGVPAAVLPAGTANLFAANLGIPDDLEEAVAIGLHGERRALDLGIANDEHFGVMAGTGLDALMIRDADRALKDRVGRAAYLWTGARNLRRSPAEVRVDVDGERFYEGPASCVLVANMGTILGGLRAFDDARPDDGLLDVGVVQAVGPLGWARVLTRMALGRSDRSPLTEVTQARSVVVRLDEARPYQLDGGDREPTKRLEVRVDPGAALVCAPPAG